MFDIDGTLVNSFKFDEECYLKAARVVLGVEISSNWDDYKHATDVGILYEAIGRYKIQGQKHLIHQKFRKVFIGLITEYIDNNPKSVHEIFGAARFIRYLCKQKNVRVAIASGGLEETAKLKLKAAGIDINGCAFASSSEHHTRTEIMRMAESKASLGATFKSKTYFGDALWDKKASKSLGYRFILVGDRIKHKNQITDFKDMKSILAMLNL